MRMPLKSLPIGIACGTLLLASTCRAVTDPQPSPGRYVRFIEGLVVPSGLVQGRPNDNFTTAWKNALAAMVFLHEGNVSAARGILDVFRDYQQSEGAGFRGVPQGWDAGFAVPVAQGDQPDENYY
ncbi:MAG: hypothetical protein JSW71_03580, partial [Gemmatimonadota bacterium]